jgi:hypothetical protein
MRTISNIVVDIETIPGLDKPGPDDISVPANYKNPETIEKYRTDPDRINELVDQAIPGLYQGEDSYHSLENQ